MDSISWMACQLRRTPSAPRHAAYNPRPRGSITIGGSAWVVLRLLLALNSAPVRYSEIQRMTELNKGQIDYAVRQLFDAALIERSEASFTKCSGRMRYIARL